MILNKITGNLKPNTDISIGRWFIIYLHLYIVNKKALNFERLLIIP